MIPEKDIIDDKLKVKSQIIYRIVEENGIVIKSLWQDGKIIIDRSNFKSREEAEQCKSQIIQDAKIVKAAEKTLREFESKREAILQSQFDETNDHLLTFLNMVILLLKQILGAK